MREPKSIEDWSEADLLNDRSPAAMAELYRRYTPVVTRFLTAQGFSNSHGCLEEKMEDIEDMQQITLKAVFSVILQEKARPPLGNLIVTIARRRWTDLLRRFYRKKEALNKWAASESNACYHPEGLGSDLDAALASLTDEDAQLVDQRIIQGKKWSEIDGFYKSENTLRKRMNEALKKMRSLFQKGEKS